MLERAHVRNTLIPLAVMWVAIIVGMTLLVHTPGVRVWMAVIAALVTLTVVFRSWLDTRKA